MAASWQQLLPQQRRRVRRRQQQQLAARASMGLLLLLVARAAWVAEAVRRLPGGVGAPWRMLMEPSQTAAIDRAFEVLGRRGLAADAASADEHLVSELPGLAAGALPSKQWAGLLTADAATQGKLFYWFFEAEQDPQDKPLLIWLNGGPGCSSMDGLFLENGPFKVDETLTVTVNPHGWHKAANVLYVDQPVGTGYSFTGTRAYCNDDACINRHFFAFLQAFFRLHPWLLVSEKGTGTATTTRPVFFSGESQAGHYIPSMVDYILTQNARAPVPVGEVVVDVQGMAIGNGWFDPPNQYDVSAFAHGVGLISHGQYLTLQKGRAKCVQGLAEGQYFNPVCFSLLDEVVAATGTERTGFVSLYDYRLFDHPSDRQFPPGHKTVERYLNQATVKAALHAAESPMVFQECTDPPYDHLKQQDGLGVMPQVKRILENGRVRALFFNGAFDVICNHRGNEAALKQLEWAGQAGFLAAPRGVWLPDGDGNGGKPGGYAKSSGVLTYLVVLDAGHMVPLDVPAAALDMARRFLAGRSFQDREQGIGMSLEEPPAAAAAAAAVEGIAAAVALPSGPPTLKGVKVLGLGEVELTVEPPSGDEGSKGQHQEGLWYSVLVNPGGSLLTPAQDKATRGTLRLTGLKDGVAYTFQAVANTAGGASRPSEPPVALTLGCSGAGEVCENGLCGFDAVADAKRCFCYRGWDGAGCSSQEAEAAAEGGDGRNKAGGVLPPTGRVTFVVDQSCAGDEHVQECALRFTVPLRVLGDAGAAADGDKGPSSSSAAAAGGDGGAVLGLEESKALEGMLRRDLALAMDVHKEQVALRSLHPLLLPANASGDGGGGEGKGEEAPMALTFDVLYAPDPAATVQAFTVLWAQPEGPLRRGLVTASFDVVRDAEVLLVARDAPLADVPANAVVDARRPLRRSVAVSLAAVLLIGFVLLAVVRYSRRKLGGSGGMVGSGGGGGGRTGAGAGGVSMTVMAGSGSPAGSGGGGHARVQRRPEMEVGTGLDEEDDEVVEVMEIRASTDSGRGGGGGGSIRLGLGGSRPASRSAASDDGASERLV